MPEVAPEVEPSIVTLGVLTPVELDVPVPVVLTTDDPCVLVVTPVLAEALDVAGAPPLVVVVAVLVDALAEVPWSVVPPLP